MHADDVTETLELALVASGCGSDVQSDKNIPKSAGFKVSRFAQFHMGTNRIEGTSPTATRRGVVAESSGTLLQTGKSKMTFTEYTLDNTPINARPDCPQCTAQMDLARIEPEKPGHDLRTFECPRCHHLETAVARFK
jgi:hypothetical protein